MKHLLIILISILLLSSFLISCEKKEGTLYRWGKYPPYVWKEFGDKETQLKYIGEVNNGKPNGLGIMTTIEGDKYVGRFPQRTPNMRNIILLTDIVSAYTDTEGVCG